MVDRGAEGLNVDIDCFVLLLPYKTYRRPYLHLSLSYLCTQGTSMVMRRGYARILSGRSLWRRKLELLALEALVRATFATGQHLVSVQDRGLSGSPGSYRDSSSGI